MALSDQFKVMVGGVDGDVIRKPVTTLTRAPGLSNQSSDAVSEHSAGVIEAKDRVIEHFL